jgi:hypothetical protein
MSTVPIDKEKELAKPIGEKAAEPAKPAVPQAPVLGVTTYDRVVSILLTFMMIFGLGTATFGAIWFSNQQWITHRPPPKIDVIEVIEDVEGGGAEDGVLGESLYAPGPEAPDVSSAANPDDVTTDTPAVEQQMTAVLNAVGAAMEISDTLMMGTDVGSSALPGGNPRGTGKHRNLGKGPGDGGGVKRAERWEISFDAGQTEEEYARQLDFFRVELGAIVERKMYMVSNMSGRKPDVKITAGGPDEKRLYFSWRSGGRRQIDLNLLTKAGVPLAGNVVVLQFYPFETEQHLARLEQEYLQKSKNHKDMRVVRKTKFSVVKKGSGYEIQITKQEYLGEKA